MQNKTISVNAFSGTVAMRAVKAEFGKRGIRYQGMSVTRATEERTDDKVAIVVKTNDNGTPVGADRRRTFIVAVNKVQPPAETPEVDNGGHSPNCEGSCSSDCEIGNARKDDA